MKLYFYFSCFIFVWLLVSASIAFGAGAISDVHLSEVHSVRIELKKVTIIGSGYVEFRIISDIEAAKESVLGQPAQLVGARTTRGTFEIVPYFSGPAFKESMTSDNNARKLKKLSEEWWAVMKESYESIRIGDAVTIHYQQGQIILSEFQVNQITGAGSVSSSKQE